MFFSTKFVSATIEKSTIEKNVPALLLTTLSIESVPGSITYYYTQWQ